MQPGWLSRHRWPLVAAAALLAYALAGFVLAPWLLGRQVVEVARERLGREASVGAIEVNPFAFSLRVHDLRLKDVEFPAGLQTSDDPTHAFEAPLWISAMPTQVSPQAWRDLLPQTPQRPELVVHVSKGILQSTHQTLSQALAGIFEVPVGALSLPERPPGLEEFAREG